MSIPSWTASDKLYIGCFDGTCGTSHTFKAHSITIHSDKDFMTSNTLQDIPFNEWFTSCITGTRDWGEDCDDRNYNTGDGCTPGCAVEANWVCSGGSTSTQDTCADDCGDGVNVQSSVVGYCDDGNNSDGDGCDQNCNVEDGYVCSGGSMSSADTCTMSCASATPPADPTIYCKDRNIDPGDGCDSSCKVESGYTCSWDSVSLASVCADTCGDGAVMTPTQGYCDDGDSDDNDGCSSTCAVEAGWSCSLGDSSTASTCSDSCGDGKVMNLIAGYCDDGNTATGDGCSDTCQIEPYWECTLGDSSTASICSDICGDSRVVKPTVGYCDDGDRVNGDGCSYGCLVESGWQCTLGDAATASVCSDDCGDGKVMSVQAGYCDDGGNDDGDGCSSTCVVETGWTCTSGDSSTASTCSDTCGDGKVMDSQAGYCDDGGKTNNDGCSSSCAVESGWTCTLGDTSTASVCTDDCGDGKVMDPASGYCDDGDNDDNDGCSSTCAVEPGWICTTGDSTTASSCSDNCGDSKVMNPQSGYCDDGSYGDGDGCNSTCEVETGWECTLGDSSTSSSCSDKCGDGKVMISSSLYCDDGNNDSGDGCSDTCQIESGWTCTSGNQNTASVCIDSCGDGLVMNPQAGYCDDGGDVDNDGCSSNCEVEVGWDCTLGDSTTSSVCSDKCADGIIVDPKIGYCDDGNTINGDGCDSSCGVEPNVSCTIGDSTTASVCTDICGDGFISINTLLSTYCDDGNNNDGDGCSSICEVESGWECTQGTSSTQSVCTSSNYTQTKCSVSYCETCSLNSRDICDTCEDGFQLLKDGTCRDVQVSTSVQKMSKGTQAVVGVGSVAAIAASILNGASPCAIWSMANQLQLLLLLLLTQSSLPSDVRGYIINNSMFSFSMDFDFIPLKTNFLTKVPLDWMSKGQTNLELEDMGQESGSSFNNNFSFAFYLILGCMFHCVLCLLPRKLDYQPRNFKERVIKFIGGLWKSFTFGFYLRFILEGFQNILLSSVNELKHHDLSTVSLQVSTAISGAFLLLLVLIMGLSAAQIFKISDPDEHSKCGELVAGLKNTKLSKAYTTLLISRRIMFCTWLIMFEYLGNSIIVCGMLCMQTCYTLYMLIVRPFEDKTNSLIECINEVFFTCFLIYLLRFNSVSTWNDKSSSMYILSMVCNNLIVVTIVFSKPFYNP
ncbi:unnamed protein product [Moneuplotes crassus]|uniref:Uncharacterized protein n=1 Tax=Euplotes crassus TaxID=5936 RepID=A0AAD1XZ54_EUPCR|nr:unnamed protein product [Moneuplotes crassus]